MKKQLDGPSPKHGPWVAASGLVGGVFAMKLNSGLLMISSKSTARPVFSGTAPASGQWVSSAESSLSVLSESDQWLPAALSFRPVDGRLKQMSMKSAPTSAQCN